MTERFAGVDIRQMHLDGREGNPDHCVAERHRGVGEAARIDHHAPNIRLRRTVQQVDQFAFVVALVTTDGCSDLLAPAHAAGLELSERLVTVNRRFALPEQV